MMGSRKGPIALEIGDRVVRAVQLAHARGKASLHAWARVPRSRASWDVSEAERLWNSLERQGFVGRSALVVMPAADSPAMLLEVRGKGPRDLDDATVRQEIARTLRLDLHAFEYHAWRAPPGGRARGGDAWMTVGCAHQRAEALVSPLDAIGVRVLGVDAGCFALARAIWAEGATASLAVATHLSWECARFVAVVDSSVVYERVLSGLGWCRFVDRAKSQTGMSEDQIQSVLSVGRDARSGSTQRALVRIRPFIDEHMRSVAHELRQSLTYLEGSYSALPLAGIALTGEGASVGGWTSVIQAVAGVTAKVASVKDLLPSDDAIPDELGTELTIPLGLAKYPLAKEVAA